MTMLHHYLRPLIMPASVALVGASGKPGSIGRIVFENLLGGAFHGTLHAVNPNHRRVLARRSHPSLVAIGKPAGEYRHARIAVGYEKPAMPPAPAATATNAAELAAKAAKEFEEKATKDQAAALVLNAQLSPWTFLIEESAAMTLAMPREQVIGVPPPPSTNAAPAATGSMPELIMPGGAPGLPAGFPGGAR